METSGGSRRTPAATWAFYVVLAAGLLMTLAANLPGHLSLDSVIALTEARTGVRQTWAPAAFSWLLRLFDQRLSGTGLYVTASATVLFGSVAGLATLRPRASWLAVIAAGAAILTPQLMVYQGIVWRDVVFANLVIAGFVLLAHAAEGRRRRLPVTALIGAALCLALAAAIRQNGVVLVVAAAMALAWTVWPSSKRLAWAWGVGGFVAVALLAVGLDRIAQPAQASAAMKLRPNAAGLILQHYDVVGAVAHEPDLKLTIIGRANPAAERMIEANAARFYSPERVDTLDGSEGFRKAMWKLPDATMSAQWREVILKHPRAYVAHRLDVFRQVFLTPDLQRCLPVHVGVVEAADLGMVAGIEPQDARMAAYASRWFGTPAYSHATYALIAVVVSGLLLLRRSPADRVMIALQLGSLAFAASFLAISVACDYRYLYLLDVAAITGLIYLALDPLVWRRS